jgi:hypothetical protein
MAYRLDFELVTIELKPGWIWCPQRVKQSRSSVTALTDSYAKYTGPSVTFPLKQPTRAAAPADSCGSHRSLEYLCSWPEVDGATFC